MFLVIKTDCKSIPTICEDCPLMCYDDDGCQSYCAVTEYLVSPKKKGKKCPIVGEITKSEFDIIQRSRIMSDMMVDIAKEEARS